MFDLHCHLLPGIDDGPQSMGQALKLAWLAEKNGITHAIVTPHIQPGLYDNNLAIISHHVDIFKDALVCHGINLELGMAAEVRVCPEIIPMLARDEIPFLGNYQGKKVLLLEFPHSMIPIGSDKLISALLSQNILPMIAHPERNKDVIRDLDKLLPLLDLGCLMQVTASSVSGYFGGKVQVRARQILENNWCTVLASDAHNEEHRPPDLKPGVQSASQIVGESNAWDLVHSTPMAIVECQFEAALLD